MASPLRTGSGLVLAVSVGIRSHRPCPTIWKAVTHHELPQGLCQRLTPPGPSYAPKELFITCDFTHLRSHFYRDL